MSHTLTKDAYTNLIQEDIEWLKQNTKDVLERRHIIDVLEHSIECYYKSSTQECDIDIEDGC